MRSASRKLWTQRLNQLFLIIIPVLLFLSLQGCSWLSRRQTLLDNAIEENSKDENAKSVSKEQYEDLLKKYEALKQQQVSANTEKPYVMKDVDNIKNDLMDARDSSLVDTVDVFSSQSNSISGEETSIVINHGEEQRPKMNSVVNTEVLENEIYQLNTAKKMIDSRDYDKAIALLKNLETSVNRQVAVRAKFWIAETLFLQKEYDLAMQIYETIIGEHAFSGVVLKTLGKLIICSEKLGLKEKQERYYSVLHDFFEEA